MTKAAKPAKTGKKPVKAAKPPETTGEKVKRVPPTAFKPGAEWTGNAAGRPPGSRNKFCKAMLNDFAEVWRTAVDDSGKGAGRAALETLAQKSPGAFVRAALQWVPQEFELGENTNGAFRQIWEALAANKTPKPPTESDDDD